MRRTFDKFIDLNAEQVFTRNVFTGERKGKGIKYKPNHSTRFFGIITQFGG
ncbi:MAG: hypothetical protein ACFFDI_19945 [Promethearchaeota archaeon]